MLVRTTSCDDGVPFDLTCDDCGEIPQADAVRRRDAEALLARAGETGSTLAARTRCRSRVVPAARAAVLSGGRGNPR